MSDSFPCLTPFDLSDHPELAVLEILHSALDTAKFAIIAAHPELDDADPDTAPTDIEVLAAENFLVAAYELKRVIAAYRGAIGTAPCWPHQPSRYDSDDPF
jgi:hypothetical protein